MYLFFEIIGTIAFAISGAMAAVRKKMDILGVVTLGITTSIGGGTIRDIIMGVTPPRSLTSPLYVGIAFVVSLLVFIPYFRKRINVDNKLLNLVDAIGLGTFTVVAFETASTLNNVYLQVFLSVLTGVGGGVLRDIFSAEEPVIFVKRFYATASLAGAVVCAVFYRADHRAAMLLGIVTTVVLRILAAKYKWNLPRAE